MHVLADLEGLERKYSDCLVVIGIDSLIFRRRTPRNLNRAIQRYGIRHPVANDDLVIWRTRWPKRGQRA